MAGERYLYMLSSLDLKFMPLLHWPFHQFHQQKAAVRGQLHFCSSWKSSRKVHACAFSNIRCTALVPAPVLLVPLLQPPVARESLVRQWPWCSLLSAGQELEGRWAFAGEPCNWLPELKVCC